MRQRLKRETAAAHQHLEARLGLLDACREITRAHPATKVIMFTFTGKDDPTASQPFFEAGASAFVSKVAAGDLLSTIKRLCIDRG